MFLGGGKTPQNFSRFARNQTTALRAVLSKHILKSAPPPKPNPVYAPAHTVGNRWFETRQCSSFEANVSKKNQKIFFNICRKTVEGYLTIYF